MGWASSGDYMQGTALKFKTKEDAIRFAEKQGYEYFVQEPNVRAFRSKAYAANFTVGCQRPHILITIRRLTLDSTRLASSRLSGRNRWRTLPSNRFFDTTLYISFSNAQAFCSKRDLPYVVFHNARRQSNPLSLKYAQAKSTYANN